MLQLTAQNRNLSWPCHFMPNESPNFSSCASRNQWPWPRLSVSRDITIFSLFLLLIQWLNQQSSIPQCGKDTKTSLSNHSDHIFQLYVAIMQHQKWLNLCIIYIYNIYDLYKCIYLYKYIIYIEYMYYTYSTHIQTHTHLWFVYFSFEALIQKLGCTIDLFSINE